MITITFTPKDGGQPTAMEVDDEVNDVFHVLGRIETRMGLVAPERDPIVERILAMRAAGKPYQPVNVVPFDPRRPGVRDSSMIAYRSLELSGRMTKQQRLVMEFLAGEPHRDFTRRELADALNLGINVVCGRVNELMKPPFEFIVELPRRRCRVTGESAHALRARVAQRLAA